MGSINAFRLSPFVRYASRTGWSEDALADLCARHGVRRAAVDSITARVPRDAAFALLEEICAASDDDNLGLHLALEATSSIGILGVLGMSLTNVREALEICTDYLRRFDPKQSTTTFYVDESGLLHLRVGPEPPEPAWLRHFAETILAAGLLTLRRFTGAQIKARWVSFRHAAPVDVTEHAALFGTTDLRFRAPTTEVVLPAYTLDLPHCNANPALAAYMRGQADALIEATGGVDLAAAVRRCLRDALEQGERPSIGHVARSFKTTSRTLQRRLAEAGVQFTTLLDQVRCEWAIALLQRPDGCLKDVAERVGFSDVRSLRRALKRRTGRTPSELLRHDRDDTGS
ncbi:AraC family transcriptional regulator ligand-binding domain-containing protein [Sorangium sp. So ce1335]|uniref:AraC family transcriptional regulator n=1 Tax=Sorangium sp. So ce1335 TaxID=3133335 RepID=UPI003F5E7C58